MEFLQCKGLQKSFGTTPILKGIDFSLKRGECLVLLGPSGCGKTTLLNAIAGLVELDAGEIICDGQLIDSPAKRTRVAMEQRRFSMVFQDFSLWPHMTVAENVAFGLKLQNRGKTEVLARTRDALAKVQMSAYADRRPAELSGGQQQRVAIARAIATQPRILLLDEPLSALDAKLREDLKRELKSLLVSTELTAVYVTHDQSEAFSLGDRVALMNGGLIEQIDTPQNLYLKPNSTFTATFIGHANLLPFHKGNDGIQILDTTVKYNPIFDTFPTHGTLVARRESIFIEPISTPSHQEALTFFGQCQSMQFLGEQTEVWINVNGTSLRGYWQNYNEKLPEVGERLAVNLPLNALHAVAS